MENEKSENEKVVTVNLKKPSRDTMVTVGIVAAVVMSAGGLSISLMDHFRGDNPITISADYGKDGNSANFTEGSIADIATSVSKSVVSILTETRTMSWFGQESTASAAGTGIIVSQDGYILTNKHVIEDANKINVVLEDGTTYKDVEVVAMDPLNDAAFLKIKDVSELTAAKLGNSKSITVGQQVVAIGNALGQFQNTVTSGIISGTGRSITASDGTYANYETLNDLIQTDAAINPGNSGGPLVNAAGEVIGINTAVSSDANNVGFAIPISSIKGMLNSLFETGKAERAYLGVYSVNITAEIAEEYELPVSAGAYVYASSKYTAVAKDSPAAKAGIKEKDIIIAVNGAKIGESGSLSCLTGEYKPGDTVQLTVLRGGEEKAINVTLGAYKEK